MNKEMTASELSFATGIPEERILELAGCQTAIKLIELELPAYVLGYPPMTLFGPQVHPRMGALVFSLDPVASLAGRTIRPASADHPISAAIGTPVGDKNRTFRQNCKEMRKRLSNRFEVSMGSTGSQQARLPADGKPPKGEGGMTDFSQYSDRLDAALDNSGALRAKLQAFFAKEKNRIELCRLMFMFSILCALVGLFVVAVIVSVSANLNI